MTHRVLIGPNAGRKKLFSLQVVRGRVGRCASARAGRTGLQSGDAALINVAQSCTRFSTGSTLTRIDRVTGDASHLCAGMELHAPSSLKSALRDLPHGSYE